ncbi:uncharacterized protein DSM5745_02417 [Aspergillus mulundensis]|uniref:Mitochondrial thiamine pyrophosphate carrier 1 n=1 Tax=Aspergillus mulundensis TaxID=1810919 RepID=A0A3D8SWE6_9EURO|nr:Uncharacterized protein DSM5745_02417 [Aspergillus mulundensis]RDW90642.1 Uncharacterized protein DSM5745_02417 [Aspergillus mulundensis]
MSEKTASTAKEFMVGAAGGITQVIIGQPFDIVKVRMQVQANRSAVQVARDIWKHEGALAFYKGTLPPLIGVGACISIVYSTNHTISHSLQSLNNGQPLTTPQTFLSGGLAGLANSLISGPTEHIRIRLQTQSQGPSPNITSTQPYNGVLSCIRHITAHSGIPGLYRGQVPTMLREFGSYGVWFSVYGYLVSRLTPPSSSSSATTHQTQPDTAGASAVPKWKTATCGAITGVVLWAANYPFDVVKSKMQADGFGAEQRYKSMRDVVRQTWRGHGVGGFWRGVGTAMGRAVPVCGGTFVVVEMR